MDSWNGDGRKILDCLQMVSLGCFMLENPNQGTLVSALYSVGWKCQGQEGMTDLSLNIAFFSESG
jgi:hypothetical protein